MALVRKTPFGKATTPDLGKHEPGTWDFSKGGSKFDHNAYGFGISKTPSELANKIKETNEYYDKNVKTPLDDFKHFENALYLGPDFHNVRGRYGIHPYGKGNIRDVAYPDLIKAYGQSGGKFAAQANDPEIKKYFDEQMAYRNGLYDRVRKIPREKLDEFAHGYGPYSDPFDYEDEGYVPPKDAEEFVSWFDRSPLDWETLESYLKEKGY